MSTNLRIGWIGTGVMGLAMAGHLLEAKYPLTVFTRTKSKATALLDKGAIWADSPKEVAQNSDIVFSIVGYPSDVESISLGESGVLQGFTKDQIFCDMTTSSPELAKKISQVAQNRGCHAIDAPVTGGDVGAREKKLSIFVGGEKNILERIQPCLECLGQKILYCGKAGSGQLAKLANQVAIAGVMFSTCESILFAYKAGLNVQEWVEVMRSGAAGSRAMDTLGLRILKQDFAPGFFIDHFVKDLGLCLAECRQMGIVLPGLECAEEFYRLAKAQGRGQKGTQDLINLLASLSATDFAIK